MPAECFEFREDAGLKAHEAARNHDACCPPSGHKAVRTAFFSRRFSFEIFAVTIAIGIVCDGAGPI